MFAAGAIFLCSFLGGAHADDIWPTKPIRLVSPYPPGGTTDRIGRLFADYASANLSVPVIVENRAGGGSAVGSMIVARAAPDGYTLLLSSVATHIVAPIANPGASPDPFAFTNIGFFGGTPSVIVTSSKSDIKTLGQIFSSDREYTFGTVGNGSVGHLIGSQIAANGKVRMVHVPYTGLDALQDVMARRIDFAILAWTSVQGLIDSGDLRALGMSTEGRLPGYPNIPSLKEQGVDVVLNGWLAISAPGGLKPEIAKRLNALVVQFSSNAEIQKKLVNDIFEARSFSVDEFDRFIRQQVSEWSPRVQRAMKP